VSLGDLYPGWTRIAPGAYDDGAGGLHIDLDEMLEAAGYDATPENVAVLVEGARDIARAGGMAFEVDR
jgi:hypothetical protein